MTFEFISKFSCALADVYNSENLKEPILISRDTRSSGVLIEDLITSILLAKGINVVITGVLPTPGMSKLLEVKDFSMGIMITASHNPYNDNGIKMFGSNGFKLDSNIESKIEKNILDNNHRGDLIFNSRNTIGNKTFLKEAFNEYIELILDPIIKKSLGIKILIDCGNGAFSNLSNLLNNNKDLTFINNTPSGDNINLDCGALHGKDLLNLVRLNNYDYGIAFDGDGDRAIFVSKEYGIIETEKLACLFFKLDKDKSSNKAVVSEISNLALKHNIIDIGGELIETEVGDRFVVNAVKDSNAVLGCEPSGHFHFPKYSKSMDGFLAMQNFLLLIVHYQANLDKELYSLEHYERIQENISIEKYPNIELQRVRASIKPILKENYEKLIIRKSMWDPVIRIYYDYRDKNNFIFLKENLINILSKSAK